MISRRDWLKFCIKWLSLSLTPLSGYGSTNCKPLIYLGASATGGNFQISGFTGAGTIKYQLPLPVRGHAFAIAPCKQSAVVFARRPGRYACAFNLIKGIITNEFSTPENRHFYGHGVFSKDGCLLYATENNFQEGVGTIGIYDSEQNYRRVGEIQSYGIGPHEIRLLSDGDTLVVANGGILTHPDLPRVKLNLPSMSSSLCYVDRHSGRLLQKVQPDSSLFQLGIRHIDVSKFDTVAIAGQYEGPAGNLVPLVALHHIQGVPNSESNHDLQFLAAPHEVLRAMKQYCGSVCFDSSGQVCAVSAPRGNLITFWDTFTGNFLSAVKVQDSSGVAPGEQAGEFLASSGNGEVFVVNSHSSNKFLLKTHDFKPDHWDNHLMV